MGLSFTIETEKRADECCITEAVGIPGALVYVASGEDAIAKVQALAPWRGGGKAGAR